VCMSECACGCVCMCVFVFVCVCVCVACVCVYICVFMCVYVCVFFNFISQHVPLQKAILNARICLYLTCVICFYIYTKDFLLRNTDLVLMQAYSYLMSRRALCLLQSVKFYRIHKHLKQFCVNVG